MSLSAMFTPLFYTFRGYHTSLLYLQWWGLHHFPGQSSISLLNPSPFYPLNYLILLYSGEDEQEFDTQEEMGSFYTILLVPCHLSS